MASLTDAITLLFGASTLLFCGADAYYCEWSFCEPDLYCCGNNQCCSKVYSPWYFWAGAVVVALLLWSCGGMLRYCYVNRHQNNIKYQDIESANLQLEEKHGTP